MGTLGWQSLPLIGIKEAQKLRRHRMGIQDNVSLGSVLGAALEGTMVAPKEAVEAPAPKECPIASLTSEDYAALAAPHGIDAEDMENILQMTTKGITLSDMGLSLGIAPEVLAGIAKDDTIVDLAKRTILYKAQVNLSINDLMDSMQLKGLQNLNMQMDTLTPMETLAVVVKLGDAKRKSIPMRPASSKDDIVGAVVEGDVVELTVIPALAPKVKVNKLNQITEVDGKALETITTQGLRELADEISNQSNTSSLEGI